MLASTVSPYDAAVPALRIIARDPASRARAGLLDTPHGTVRTPAFVPLATRASVRGLSADDVAALDYDIVLGNAFHLLLAPGGELIDRLGGLHRFMGWQRTIITDSGGFQVFSLGHGTVADEIKGSRGGGARGGAILSIAEEGVRFRSYLDGAERFIGPETSMEIQAQLHSDIVLAFDECTPFHVEREYTARSTERTHRWLERCIRWRAERSVPPSLFYGIVQGGIYEDLRVESVAAVCASGCDGVAIGGSLGQEKAQMHGVVDWSTRELERVAPERPRHLLGIGEIDDLIRGVELGIDSFDCAVPTRLGRHGVALVPDPAARWRLAVDSPRCRDDAAPVLEGCTCLACRQGLSRAYLHFLLRSGERNGARLLTLHNLTFVASVMSRLRAAIVDGRLGEEAAALRAGA
jgi:queuine tRNA-ribosyltransferase